MSPLRITTAAAFDSHRELSDLLRAFVEFLWLHFQQFGTNLQAIIVNYFQATTANGNNLFQDVILHQVTELKVQSLEEWGVAGGPDRDVEVLVLL